MENEEIHIGNKIKEIVKNNGISNAEFARRINTTSQNAMDIYSRKSIDTDKLQVISKILNHDFFSYYRSEKSQIKFTGKSKIIIEMELNDDDILKLNLKDKIFQIFNK